MEKTTAINLIKQVCVNYKGTLQEHQLLQEAIKVLSEESQK